MKANSSRLPRVGVVKPVSTSKEFGVAIIIVLLVLVSFSPTLNNGFVDWDDTGNLLENLNYRGLSPSHLTWMFTTFHYGHYQPLAWLSFSLDYMLWGMNPKGYHLTSVVLHALNAVLFYFLIRAFLKRQPSLAPWSESWGFRFCCASGALFFALNPLRVESVAWATERRDVLSGFFYLLTLLAYLRAHAPKSSQKKKWLLLSLLCMALSLLSKAWGITLPVVLLILDVYPLRRLQGEKESRSAWKRLLLEKIPYAVVALIFAMTAFIAAKRWAMEMVTNHGLASRFMQAAFGLCFYVWKTVVPTNLSPIYLLRPSFNPAEAKFVVCAVLVAATTAGLVALRRRWPWALAGWICYGVIVSPVLGLAQSGEQIAADRYSYLSCLPFALLVAAGLAQLWLKWQRRLLPTVWWFLSSSIAAAVLLAFATLTFRQTRIWQNSFALWNHALQVDPSNYLAHQSRSLLFYGNKSYPAALNDANEAIRWNPKKPNHYLNRGNVRWALHDSAGAMEDYNTAIRFKSKNLEICHNNRGAIRQVQGDLPGALADYTAAIAAKPTFADAYMNRGTLRHRQKDLPGAIDDLANALKFAPPSWPHRTNVEQRLALARSMAQGIDQTQK